MGQVEDSIRGEAKGNMGAGASTGNKKKNKQKGRNSHRLMEKGAMVKKDESRKVNGKNVCRNGTNERKRGRKREGKRGKKRRTEKVQTTKKRRERNG